MVEVMKASERRHPLAITMWDFSWLERKWPGAGYEDWNQALDELVERGYDAIRIDAYPHLMAADGSGTWELLPEWSVQVWGAPAVTRISDVRGNLVQFMRLCRDRGLKVALSTWFREDRRDLRSGIASPQELGEIWVKTLEAIEQEGLLDTVLYVDLCNEFPLTCWAPFLLKATGEPWVQRASVEGTRWMRESIAVVRERYPQLEYCFSFCSEYDTYETQDVSFMDVLDLHIWMAQSHCTTFYAEVGYQYERFDATGYTNLALKGEELYRSKPEHWQQGLRKSIRLLADWSRLSGKPLVTTECWGVVDYKDWPLLDWGWVKELCEFGLREALATKRWAMLATSNFCGPQFVGMWRDVEWHRKLTNLIHESQVDLI